MVSNDEIRIIADKIEEEMYRVYGKVDNAYKNKFRSLLANITNMNNNVRIDLTSIHSHSFVVVLLQTYFIQRNHSETDRCDETRRYVTTRYD